MHQASDDSDSDFDSYINKSASEDEDLQQITVTVLQTKPATLHLLLLNMSKESLVSADRETVFTRACGLIT